MIALAFLLALQDTPHDWPQWRGARRDGVWRETGIVEKFDQDRIPLRWSVPIGGGYSGPTVAAGRVFVMDRPKDQAVERIHCLDWKTGANVWTFSYPCAYEGFEYAVGPRASVTVHDGKAYGLGAAGHLTCIDAATGKFLWTRDLRKDYRWSAPTSPHAAEVQ